MYLSGARQQCSCTARGPASGLPCLRGQADRYVQCAAAETTDRQKAAKVLVFILTRTRTGSALGGQDSMWLMCNHVQSRGPPRSAWLIYAPVHRGSQSGNMALIYRECNVKAAHRLNTSAWGGTAANGTSSIDCLRLAMTFWAAQAEPSTWRLVFATLVL